MLAEERLIGGRGGWKGEVGAYGTSRRMTKKQMRNQGKTKGGREGKRMRELIVSGGEGPLELRGGLGGGGGGNNN